MVRFLNYQHFFDFKISTPMLKNEKLKKLCIRHHTNKFFLFVFIFYFFILFICLLPVLVGAHIISYVISHSFYKKILKIYQWACEEE